MVTEVGVTELQVKQSQGFASNHQKQEETRKDPPLESLGELGPADTSIQTSTHQNWGKINFYCFRPYTCDTLLLQFQNTNTNSICSTFASDVPIEQTFL